MENWRLFVDTGGTFTDCLAVAPDGRRLRCKVLSSGALRGRVIEQVSQRKFVVEQSWGAPAGLVSGCLLVSASGEARVASFDPEASVLSIDQDLELTKGSSFEVRSPDVAPILAARLVTATPGDLPKIGMRLGTTMGTNALLEGKGAAVAFFVTEGFRDLLRIGDQTRPDLFALDVRRPEPLHAEVVCVRGRLAAGGSEIEPFQLDEAEVARCLDKGIKVAAISLLHSYRNPAHEQELKQHLIDAGFEYVVCSAELAPLIKWVPRAETAVVDAYLGPLMSQYLQSVEGAIAEGGLHVMTSAGGLVSSHSYSPKDGLLSGPAGGVVGAAAVGRRAGLNRLIAFDMGGTSTDVSRFDGDFDYRESHTVGRARLMAPALKIETVASGGGSVCGFDGELLFVGPESAGADPGPACYGAGGPLTLTDVNLLLGRLDLESFGLPVFPEASKSRLDDVRRSYEAARGEPVEPDELLQSFLAIANDRMANAIRTISVREGYDPAEYALVAFGGAGGQHACALADSLGIGRILFPADAGLLSAFGMELARVERIVERQVLSSSGKFLKVAASTLSEMEQEASGELASEGYSESQTEVRRRTAMVRYTGQEASVSIDFEQPSEIVPKFLERYRQVFGYVPEGREIEVVSLRIIASTLQEKLDPESFDGGDGASPLGRSAEALFAGGRTQTAVHRRQELRAGDILAGPAIVSDAYSTLVVEPGWAAKVGSQGSLMLDRTAKTSTSVASPAAERELFTNRFRSIVEEMGAQLERTAISTNIKERLDFSCAMLDAEGRLIVNAPHIPVHLGALGICVREVAARLDLGPGDVAITNHPAYGGSHLPDITLIAPVFGDRGTLLGYVANRAHHAEVGGIAPGSMSPNAASLLEEGVVIPPTYLFKAGDERYGEVERILTEAAWPTRRIDENMADLQAQAAANRRGEQALRRLAAEHGDSKVIEQMALISDQAARAVRSMLMALGTRDLRETQELDGGSKIVVRISISDGKMGVDFTGTSPVGGDSLNATPAVVRSALIYVLRVLVAGDIPLNEGLMEGVTVTLPPCLLNPDFGDDPADAPPVFGGNVEVSQRIVDTLLLALEAVACSQGTMNNFVMGDDRRSYYETVGGGSGAGEGFDGGSGTHVHMSNTAITDPEILEHRFPVRLRRFELRTGSGGKGRWSGGEGLVREIEFLEPQSVSLLGQHRQSAPYGLGGGQPGAVGEQTLVRADGTEEPLGSAVQLNAEAGDRLVIRTPGGGGYGPPAS